MLPKVPISCHEPSRHVHDDFFALLWANRFGAHRWVFVVLVAEHHHRDQAAAGFIIVHQLCPAVVTHLRPIRSCQQLYQFAFSPTATTSTSTLTLTVSNSAAIEESPITITGIYGIVSHETFVKLTVTK
jgi:hypothetical protein